MSASPKPNRQKIAKGLFAASIALNAILVGKALLFTPWVPFRPVCFDDDVVFSPSLRDLDGELTSVFRSAMDLSVATYTEFGIHVDKDRNVYVSLWDRWLDGNGLWNYTNHTVERILVGHGNELALPAYEYGDGRSVDRRCARVRAVAIEPDR